VSLEVAQEDKNHRNNIKLEGFLITRWTEAHIHMSEEASKTQVCYQRKLFPFSKDKKYYT